MDFSILTKISSSQVSILTIILTTLVCTLLTFLTLRSKLKSTNSRFSSREQPETSKNPSLAVSEGVEGGGMMVVEREKQTGASMMEQLVPEITTHALSYLDYPSLCRLSMTNSLMRKAANDDNAWKALYHKDFTLEQDGIRPVNGWKAYYAATRAVVNINAQFFNIIRDGSLQDMGRLWLNADYVKCFHASGEFFTGFNAVMESWQMEFNWEQGAVDFQVRDVRVRVLTDSAWVTMKAYVNMGNIPFANNGSFFVTNVFEFISGRWYMVHHHSSMMVENGGAEQPNLLG